MSQALWQPYCNKPTTHMYVAARGSRRVGETPARCCAAVSYQTPPHPALGWVLCCRALPVDTHAHQGKHTHTHTHTHACMHVTNVTLRATLVGSKGTEAFQRCDATEAPQHDCISQILGSGCHGTTTIAAAAAVPQWGLHSLAPRAGGPPQRVDSNCARGLEAVLIDVGVFGKPAARRKIVRHVGAGI